VGKAELVIFTNNNISGSIPIVLANAINLQQLQLDSNQISGLIPPELGKLTNPEVFFAWDNELEGSIPSSFENC
ncbi:Leucine-rich repeat-containing protein, partial [Cynara cardunculus var. scolymus]